MSTSVYLITLLLLTLTLTLMTQATHLLVFYKVSTECTLTHLLLTYLLLSTTLLVTKVHLHMTLDYSIAHTFLYKWLEARWSGYIPTKLDSRQDMVLSRTHSHKVMLLTKDLEFLHVTRTAITEELKLLTLCNKYLVRDIQRLLRGSLFFVCIPKQ